MNLEKFIKIGMVLGFVFNTAFSVMAQPTIIQPGDKNINPSLIKLGEFEGILATTTPGKARFVSVRQNGKEIKIEERYTNKDVEFKKRTMVLNAITLEPISSTYSDDESLNEAWYGATVRGVFNNYPNNKKNTDSKPMKEKSFEYGSLDYVVSALPLAPGYKAFIPVVMIDQGYLNFLRFQIEKVTEQKGSSCIVGEYDELVVEMRASDGWHRKTVHIDKSSRRIVRSEETFGLSITPNAYRDTYADINPIKTPFNTDEVMTMLTRGTSAITGQAWTTAGGPLSKKKQFAPKGSVVLLFPITEYHKEWESYNKQLTKSGRKDPTGWGCFYPMPKKVREASLVTDITDDNGSFSFQGLKPGEYVALVTFEATKYSHTTRTPNGVEVTVYGDGSANAQTTYDVRDWTQSATVTNQSSITIKRDGETVMVKLKK